MEIIFLIIVGYIVGKYYYKPSEKPCKEPRKPFISSFPEKDTRPIHEKHDLTKDSEYYKRTFPQYLDPEHPDYQGYAPEAPKPKKPDVVIENLTINVTHNHLHIKDEEK